MVTKPEDENFLATAICCREVASTRSDDNLAIERFEALIQPKPNLVLYKVTRCYFLST